MKAIIAGMQNAVGGNFQEEMAEMKAAVAGLQEGRHDSKQSMQKQKPEVAQAGRKQVSWNNLHSGPLTVGVDQYQEASSTDDLTVDKWNFKQSCWDGAAFGFDSQIMTCPESLYNVLLLLVNMTMQSFFIIIVWRSLAFTSLGTDAIDGFHMWRVNVGHDVRFANPLTQESLSSRVCRGDTSLHLSDTQSQTVLAINAYLYDNAPFNGPMMCLLGVCAWSLTVDKEFHAVKDQFDALTAIPRGSTHITLDVEANRLVLAGISCKRISWICFMALFRFAVALALLLAGAMFLAVTTSIEDILLNAVALEFVLNIDELLFLSLAPMKTRRFLLLLKHIPSKHGAVFKGLDRNLMCAATFTVSFLAYAVIALMMPEMDRMKDAKNEMCSGFKEFSYAMTSLEYPVWFPSEQSVDEALSNLRQSRRYWILRMVIDSNNISETRTNVWVKTLLAGGFSGPGSTLLALTTLGVEYFAKKDNPECYDWLNSFQASNFFDDGMGMELLATAYASIQDAANDQTLENCEDLTKYCNIFHLPGPTVRLFCAWTCGCDNPGSSLAIYAIEYGCSYTCEFASYTLYFLLNRSCVQPLVKELKADPQWVELMGHWKIATSRWAGEMSFLFGNHMAGLLVNWGCFASNILQISWGYDSFLLLCLPAGGLKSISFWCPASCQCNTTVIPGCPRSCVSGQPVPTQSTHIQYSWPSWTTNWCNFTLGCTVLST
jgi:hypothetical protein